MIADQSRIDSRSGKSGQGRVYRTVTAKRYKPEEIIAKLREAEVLLAEGVGVGEVVRRLGVTQVT